jgi:hypothetical protein
LGKVEKNPLRFPRETICIQIINAEFPLPQNVPLSLLMRLIAPRVAAAALDGGRP